MILHLTRNLRKVVDFPLNIFESVAHSQIINVHEFESCLWSIIKENNPPSWIFYIYSTHNFTHSWMINYSSFVIQFASIKWRKHFMVNDTITLINPNHKYKTNIQVAPFWKSYKFFLFNFTYSCSAWLLNQP